MKTLVLGDTHGRSLWKLITHLEQPDRVIFIGDYFDSWDLSAVEQMYNFNEIIEYKESNKTEVILLIGNHDHHYFPEVGHTGTSGYQYGAAAAISQVIDENRNHLQMAYQMDDFLFTHAGVSPVFMDNAFGQGDWDIKNVAFDLNQMFKFKPRVFDFEGREPSGDNITQTPIWIRPRSLMASNNKHEKSLKKTYRQVVGHTEVKRIDTKGGATGGRYYVIDTLATSGEYMIINDGVISFNTWKS